MPNVNKWVLEAEQKSDLGARHRGLAQIVIGQPGAYVVESELERGAFVLQSALQGAGADPSGFAIDRIATSPAGSALIKPFRTRSTMLAVWSRSASRWRSDGSKNCQILCRASLSLR